MGVLAYLRDLTRRMLSFRHVDLPDGPWTYRAAGYCLKAVCWTAVLGAVLTTLGFLTLLIFVVAFFGFISAAVALGGVGAVLPILIGLGFFGLIFLLAVIVYAGLAALVVVPVGDVYKTWCRRDDGALGRAVLVGIFAVAFGLLMFLPRALQIGSDSLPVTTVPTGFGVAGLFAGFGAALLALSLAPATRQTLQQPAHPTPDASMASTELDRRVRYRCPGCGTVYALAERPPEGSLCPSCRDDEPTPAAEPEP